MTDNSCDFSIALKIVIALKIKSIEHDKLFRYIFFQTRAWLSQLLQRKSMFKSTYYLLYNRYLSYRQSYHVPLFLIILWNIFCSKLYFTCLFATMRSWRFSVLFFSENCDSAVFASSILWWLAASTTYTTVFALNSFRNSDQYNLALIKPPPAPTKIEWKEIL